MDSEVTEELKCRKSDPQKSDPRESDGKRYPVYKGLIKVCANFVICKYERTQHTSVIFVILSTRLFVYFPVLFFFSPSIS
jgi:hypothetical protein